MIGQEFLEQNKTKEGVLVRRSNLQFKKIVTGKGDIPDYDDEVVVHYNGYFVDGYKISITFAIIVTVLSYIIGIAIGACLGYFAGKLDLFGVRLMEIFSAVPFLFTLMILASFMQPNVCF